MRKDLLAVPAPNEKVTDYFSMEYVKYNYPECFQHKEYPTCLSCNTKYVPIDKGDEWCFKCKLMR